MGETQADDGADRVGRAGQPGDDGVGHGRLRHRAGRLPRPVGARGGRRQVARRVRVGGQPGAAPAPHRQRDAQRRRPAGSRRRPLARPRAARPACAPGATVVASIWGRTVDEYAAAAALLAAAPPQVVAVEVNLSCPNLAHDGQHSRDAIFAHDAALSAEVIAATAACGRPRWAKLSANTDRIVDVAAAVADAGAEAVTCINTLLGLAYDPVDPPAGPRRRRRRAVRAGDPPRRRARRPRRPRRVAGPADRRRRRRGDRAGTPRSCSSPARWPCRSARRRSPILGPRPASCASSPPAPPAEPRQWGRLSPETPVHPPARSRFGYRDLHGYTSAIDS